jgi:hypothetical protein
MAVLKAKPQKIVEFYLAMLQQSLVSPLVVTRATDADFVNALNDTVTLRIGGLRATARDYEFRTRNEKIQFDDIEGGDGIDIKLDTHITSGTVLTDEHLTLDNIQFAQEVIEPQLAAVAGRIEAKVVAGLRAANSAVDFEFGDNEDPFLIALELKRRTDAFKVAPASGRTFLVGSDIAAQFLASDRLSEYQSTGQTGTPALRDAVIGRLAGSPVVEVPALAPNEGFYLHKTGLVVGNIAPVIPRGAAAGARYTRDGWSARWIADYDADYARDRSIVSTFLGVNDVVDERDANGDLVAEANRRNVRIAKFTYTGDGAVWEPTATAPVTP